MKKMARTEEDEFDKFLDEDDDDVEAPEEEEELPETEDDENESDEDEDNPIPPRPTQKPKISGMERIPPLTEPIPDEFDDDKNICYFLDQVCKLGLRRSGPESSACTNCLTALRLELEHLQKNDEAKEKEMF